MGSDDSISDEDRSARTAERQKQAEPYFLALGRFVSVFAQVESMLATVLWKHAGVPPPLAQAVFSGVRTEAAMQYIRRIADAQNWPAAHKTNIELVFAQLSALTKLRNDILHFGASMDEPSVWTVSNKNFVHIPDRVRETKITSNILDDASWDLGRIVVWCVIEGWADDDLRRPDVLIRFLNEHPTWRYKSPLQDHGSRKNRKEPRKRPRRPQPSQE